MASPLSKRKNKWQKRRPMTVSSAFRPISIVELPGPECNPSFGLLQLDDWLATYEHDILQYDSLAAFAQVKLDEARRLSSKCPHPMNRFRVAVMCNLFERAACALATSESFKRYSTCILALRDEILDMVLVDVQDDDAVATIARDVPRTLSFFLQKLPHVIALRLEQEKVHNDTIVALLFDVFAARKRWTFINTKLCCKNSFRPCSRTSGRSFRRGNSLRKPSERSD
ncbi:hypothetical protein AC1031_014965 [Aphanomyces cochlioides]|nr:hypothetical protein AC1031_014965 [Aphanomyces cochlioides]